VNRKKLIGALLLLLLILMVLCTWCHLGEIAQKQMLQQSKSISDNTLSVPPQNVNVQSKNKALNRILSNKDTKTEEKARAIQEKIQALLALEHIHFKSNSSGITDKSKEIIHKIAKILKGHPNQQVEIEGHTDYSGNNDLNLKLSQERVDNVKKALTDLGINAQRLEAVGYGATKQLVSNDTKENRQINRRVEFKIIGE